MQAFRGAAESAVRIRLVDGVRDGVALSLVEQRGAWREAAVWIDLRQPGRYVEAIAHELEHVLEHLDGTDLARLARQRVDGVVDLGGQDETARAQSIGRTVAREALVR